VPAGAEGLKSTCAAVYEHPVVRWLLGGELHPGGEQATRRALQLIRVAGSDRLLDVASGSGTSALLAARELGASVTGIEYGEQAVLAAAAAAGAERLDGRVHFIRGDAEALPFPDASFDAVLCECSLCTFPDKSRAAAEIGRVLRARGRAAISDVVIDPDRLPAELLGPIATVACVGSALTRAAYGKLLADAGLELDTVESLDREAASLVERIEERLRGARLLGLGGLAGSPYDVDEAIELTRLAKAAIEDGSIGYSIFAATKTPVPGSNRRWPLTV
jgi:arsenite methyltransferase